MSLCGARAAEDRGAVQVGAHEVGPEHVADQRHDPVDLLAHTVGDPRPKPEQDAVLGDGRARRDEERHTRLGRRHDLELLAEGIAHGAEPGAGRHRLARPDVRLPPARLLRARPDEAADEPLRALGRLDVARQHPERAKDVREPAHVRLDGLLLEEAAAAGFRGDRGNARRGGRLARRPADCRPVRLRADHVGQAVGHGHRARPLADRRLVVEGERLERLHEVAAVDVDERVGRCDQLGEDVVGQLLGVRPVRVAGEAPVGVLAVGGRDECGPAGEHGRAHDRDGDHRPREYVRVEASHEPPDGRDARVLAAVDARQDAQSRPVRGTVCLEARPLLFGQRGAVKRQHFA